MKILVSAAACNPKYGSESAVGWKTVVALARFHEVHVLTSLENRTGIEEYAEKTEMSNLSFTYFGHTAPYHPHRLIARAQSWLRYLRWTAELPRHARTLNEKYRFDIAHHVTLSTYRVGSPLWELGIPSVFGPVGGGEQLPGIAASSMSSGQRMQEHCRSMANRMARFSPKLLNTIRNFSVLISSNQATARKLLSLGANPAAIHVLPAVFFPQDQIDDTRRKPKLRKTRTEGLKLFSSGMLEGRKGLSIAFQAVRLAVNAGLKVDFTIPSRGPEFSFLRRLAQKLSLSDVIRFPESLPREEYWAQLLASDIYMAPSLRDNCPATLLEAMLCRCVPIVANCNGPGEVVSPAYGEVIGVATPECMAADIAERLMKLDRNRSELAAKADAASDHVANTFTESRYLRSIAKAYNAAVERHAAVIPAAT